MFRSYDVNDDWDETDEDKYLLFESFVSPLSFEILLQTNSLLFDSLFDETKLSLKITVSDESRRCE